MSTLLADLLDYFFLAKIQVFSCCLNVSFPIISNRSHCQHKNWTSKSPWEYETSSSILPLLSFNPDTLCQLSWGKASDFATYGCRKVLLLQLRHHKINALCYQGEDFYLAVENPLRNTTFCESREPS